MDKDPLVHLRLESSRLGERREMVRLYGNVDGISCLLLKNSLEIYTLHTCRCCSKYVFVTYSVVSTVAFLTGLPYRKGHA